MRPLIFALTLVVLPLIDLPLLTPPSQAQTSDDTASPQTMETRPDAIAKGEIGLEGRIKAITGPNNFDIAASSFTTEDGRTIEFDEAKPKSITAVENAIVVPGDDLAARLTMKEVKLGLRVRLIGRNLNGQPFQARLIVLSDVGGKYEKARAIQMSAPVASTLAQGAKAFEAGDFARAMTFYKQAQGMAAGNSDKNGLTSSLTRQASAYREMNQPQKAEAAFAEALKVAESGAPDSMMVVLANYGSLLQSMNRTKEAIPMLERARTFATRESEGVQILLGKNVASAYASDGQWDQAIAAWNSIVARQHATGKLDEELETLLSIAAAQLKAGKPDESTKTFAVGQERFKAITDPTQRAQAQLAYGTYYARLDNAAQARVWLGQALTSFETLNDARSAASVRRALEALNKPAAPPAAATPGAATPAAPAAPAAPTAPGAPAPTPDQLPPAPDEADNPRDDTDL